MMSQPSTQPQKVLRQTTLFSFRTKQPTTTVASMGSATVAIVTPSCESGGEAVTAVRRTLFDEKAPQLGRQDRPQCPTVSANTNPDDEDDEDDVPLGAILTRSTSSLHPTDTAASIAAKRPREVAPSCTSKRDEAYPRRPVSGRRQLQLDFGQTIRTTETCALCGMVFTNTETDVALHRRQCRPLAAAVEDKQRKAFVEDLFADCDGRAVEGGLATSSEHVGRRDAPPVKQRGTHTRGGRKPPSVLRTRASTLSLLEAAATNNNAVRMVPLGASSQWSAALLDGNAAHHWGKAMPVVVERLVGTMHFGPSLSLMADAQRLAVQDAAMSESYLEHRRNMLVVLVLDKPTGECMAALVGAEMFRQHEAECIDGGDAGGHVVVRRSTRCDVLQVWAAPDATANGTTAKRVVPTNNNVTPAPADRVAFLFENIVGAPKDGFWASGKRSHASTSMPSAPRRHTAALQAALETLGKHIVYGCRVDWTSDMCFAQGLLAADADACDAVRQSSALDELLLGRKSRQFRFAWDIDVDAFENSVMNVQGATHDDANGAAEGEGSESSSAHYESSNEERVESEHA